MNHGKDGGDGDGAAESVRARDAQRAAEDAEPVHAGDGGGDDRGPRPENRADQ